MRDKASRCNSKREYKGAIVRLCTGNFTAVLFSGKFLNLVIRIKDCLEEFGTILLVNS